MLIPLWVWLVTIVGLFTIMVIDLVIVDWRRRQFTPRDAVRWVFLSILLTVLFCSVVWVAWGGRYSGQFLAVYLTEYSLSADNLLVTVLIMSTFAVPEIRRHQVLAIGIMLAFVLRAVAITVGVAAIHAFGWIFYLFGAFLIYTAWKVLTTGNQEDQKFTENIVLRALRAVLPVTGDYHGSRLLLRLGRKVWVTPLLLVVIAIGTTDLLFAVDSIPADFGLTREPFLVLAANALALTGLRQLYFVVGHLVTKLAYLAHGLGVILGFIGGKLILDTLHGNTLPFLNKGHPVPVPTVGSGTSLAVIVVTLTVAVLASAWKARSDGRAAGPELDSRAVHEPVERL